MHLMPKCTPQFVISLVLFYLDLVIFKMSLTTFRKKSGNLCIQSLLGLSLIMMDGL